MSLPEAAFPRPRAAAMRFAAAFDRAARRPRRRGCVDWSPAPSTIVAEAVRVDLRPDSPTNCATTRRSIGCMNPAREPLSRSTCSNVSYHSPLMRALHHASYVFEKRLSHTADSQDQRHRMVPASRPLMTFADTAAPDYVTPRLIAANPRAQAVYEQAMREAWAAKNRLLALGVPLEFALYVLPNAKALRMVESGLAPRAAAQVDAAHLLQRAGGDLPGVDGRDRAGARDPPAARPPHRPAVRAAQRHRRRRAAPKARTSAACRSGTASRTPSAASSASGSLRDAHLA